MTVGELIEQLRRWPADTKVEVGYEGISRPIAAVVTVDDRVNWGYAYKPGQVVLEADE